MNGVKKNKSEIRKVSKCCGILCTKDNVSTIINNIERCHIEVDFAKEELCVYVEKKD